MAKKKEENTAIEALKLDLEYRNRELAANIAAQAAARALEEKRMLLIEQGMQAQQAEQFARTYALQIGQLEFEKSLSTAQLGMTAQAQQHTQQLELRRQQYDEEFNKAQQMGFSNGVPTLDRYKFDSSMGEQQREFDVETSGYSNGRATMAREEMERGLGESQRQFNIGQSGWMNGAATLDREQALENQRQFDVNTIMNAPRGAADYVGYIKKLRGLEGQGLAPGLLGEMATGAPMRAASLSNGGQEFDRPATNLDLAQEAVARSRANPTISREMDPRLAQLIGSGSQQNVRVSSDPTQAKNLPQAWQPPQQGQQPQIRQPSRWGAYQGGSGTVAGYGYNDAWSWEEANRMAQGLPGQGTQGGQPVSFWTGAQQSSGNQPTEGIEPWQGNGGDQRFGITDPGWTPGSAQAKQAGIQGAATHPYNSINPQAAQRTQGRSWSLPGGGVATQEGGAAPSHSTDRGGQEVVPGQQVFQNEGGTGWWGNPEPRAINPGGSQGQYYWEADPSRYVMPASWSAQLGDLNDPTKMQYLGSSLWALDQLGRNKIDWTNMVANESNRAYAQAGNERETLQQVVNNMVTPSPWDYQPYQYSPASGQYGSTYTGQSQAPRSAEAPSNGTFQQYAGGSPNSWSSAAAASSSPYGSGGSAQSSRVGSMYDNVYGEDQTPDVKTGDQWSYQAYKKLSPTEKQFAGGLVSEYTGQNEDDFQWSMQQAAPGGTGRKKRATWAGM